MIRLVRARNPGPMTLEGTNTWLLGRERVLVVDPGPEDAPHVARVLLEVEAAGGSLGAVLLSHRHDDHAGALRVQRLRDELERSGATVFAADLALGVSPVTEAVRRCTDADVAVVPLAGHTDDSLGVVLPGERAVCTGDTVLGRGASVIAHPEGDLTAYLASLRVLDRLVGGAEPVAAAPWRGLPGHGPEIPDLAVAVRALREHRSARVRQVVEALDGRGVDALDPAPALLSELLAAVYPEVADPVLQSAALRTIRATLVHLTSRGVRQGPGHRRG